MVVLIGLVASAVPVAAQTASAPPSAAPVAESSLASMPSAALSAVPHVATDSEPRRSLVLPALQITFGALQVMDVISTQRALNAGLTEGNVLMQGIVERPVMIAALKGGATAATMLLMNRVARKNRAAAIATMVALNAAYSVVVARNIRAVEDR